MPAIDPAHTVARIVLDHPETAEVFQTYRIDFCCRGNRTLARDYEVPEWGCATYRALFRSLQELEGDTLRHVHLENHVLMPRFATRDNAHRRSA